MLGRIILIRTAASLFLMLLIPTVSFTARHVVILNSNEISIHTPSDTTLGNYYTLQFQVPQEIQGKTLYGAYLEFYADVSSLEGNGYLNESPMIEVYALKSSFSGILDSTQFEMPSPTVRNINIGEKRRIRIDITEIAKSYMEVPENNHGLILGSLRGSRDGIFSIRNDIIAENSVARIIYHYDSRVRK